MELDEVTRMAILELQQEFKAQGKNYSFQEIAEIVASQFKVANIGFTKGVNVRLPIFGTFVKKDIVKIKNRNDARQAMKDNVSEEEFKAMVIRDKEAHKAEVLAQREKDRATTFTLEDLKKIDSRYGTVNKYLKHTDEGRN